MVRALLFLCLGFLIAVLYIDLVFDTSALPHRRVRASLPPAVVDPIALYYRYITRNPYPLMLVMLTATGCIVAEIVYRLTPGWVAWTSLALIGAAALVSVIKVIPTAQRLAIGNDNAAARSDMIRMMLPYHLALLSAVLMLAAVQFLDMI